MGWEWSNSFRKELLNVLDLSSMHYNPGLKLPSVLNVDDVDHATVGS